MTESDSAQSQSLSLRLHYLDGLRGLAALYVTLHHAYLQVFPNPEQVLPVALAWGTHWLEYGSFSVAIFIVLSGYCLMLPVAKSGVLAGGAWHYIQRRARRIIPPYYAAIAFTLLLTAIFPWLQTQAPKTIWAGTQPGFALSSLASHLLLIHNFKSIWISKINYPMWSIAIEWQIYFFLPFLLIPLWKRLGLGAMAIASVLIGFAPHYLMHGALDWTKPWYLTLFTMGAIAALIGVSSDLFLVNLRQRLPWGSLALCCVAGLLALVVPQQRVWLNHSEAITDPMVGLFMMCLLMQCTKKATAQKAMEQKAIEHSVDGLWHAVVSLLSTPLVLGLGAFSYSLYLIHAPILAAIDLPLLTHGVAAPIRFAVAVGIGVPLRGTNLSRENICV